MKTIWSIFRDLVNSKPIGTEITRQEIISEIERNGFINHYVWSAPKTLKKYFPATLDAARNMSEKVGYFVQL